MPLSFHTAAVTMLSFLPLIHWNLSSFIFLRHRPHFLPNFLKDPFFQSPCPHSHIAVLCHVLWLSATLLWVLPPSSHCPGPRPLLHFCVLVNGSTHLVSGKLHSAGWPACASRSFGCHVSLGASLQGAEFAYVRQTVGGLPDLPTCQCWPHHCRENLCSVS